MPEDNFEIVFDLYGPGWAHLQFGSGSDSYSLDHISDVADTLSDLGRMALQLACGAWSVELLTELEPGFHRLKAEVGEGWLPPLQRPVHLSATRDNGEPVFGFEVRTVRTFAAAALRCLETSLAECQFVPLRADWQHSDPPTEQELRFWGRKPPRRIVETLRHCLQLEVPDE